MPTTHPFRAAQAARGRDTVRRSLTSVLVVTLSASLSGAALGDTAMLTEADWMSELPSVLSVTRQKQNITEAPSSVTVITRDMIDALGANNLAEVLRLVPGFQVFYSNGLTFGATYHGFADRDPRRMEVRVNGRSVYMPQMSSVAWETIGVLPDDVDYIEVVRGSNVPAYGSNAILGAINIVTRNPVRDAGGGVNVALSSQHGRTVGIRHNDQFGGMDFSVRTAVKHTHGFDGIDDKAHTGHLVFNGVYAPNLTEELDFEIGFSNGRFGIGDTDHLDEFAEEDRQAAWISGQWQHSMENQRWKVRFSYSDYSFDRSRFGLVSEELRLEPSEITTFFPGHTDELIELEEGRRDYSVSNLEFEHHLDLSSRAKAVWGIGTRIDRAMSDWLAGDNYTDTAVYYLFGNVEWRLTPDWVINSGLMVEDKEGYDIDASPRITLHYHANPDHHWRIGATRAYRQPALMETDRQRALRFNNSDLINLQRRSHHDIAPEKVNSYELGYLGFWQNRKYSLDAKVFREEIHGAIDLIDTYYPMCDSPSPDEQAVFAARYCTDFSVDGVFGAQVDDKLRVVANTGNWTVEGIEAQPSWHYSADTWLRLDYAYLSTEGERLRKITSFRYLVPLEDTAPKQSAGLLFSHRWNTGWQVSGYLKYMDFIDWRAGTEVEPHTRFDLKISRTWQLGGSVGVLTIAGQNIFRDTYLEYQRHNEFGRRATVSFSVRWP